tara:strand:- start:626 stop:1747 length:1122 start_codon:yes stop_codon:yes gene_type:complete
MNHLTGISSVASAGWDVLVIGAGTAGCTAAATLVNAGYRTLVVDRSGFPRAKVCGGCLSPVGVDGLRRCGLGEALSRSRPRTISRIEVFTCGYSACLPLANYEVIDRCVLDQNLINQVKSMGGHFLDSTSASILPDDSVMIKSGSESKLLVPKAVVVADGLQGTSLAERPEFDWIMESRSYIGIGATVKNVHFETANDRIQMFTSKSGYLGVAPLSSGDSILAAALCPIAVKTHGRAAALNQILENSPLNSGALDTIDWHGVSKLSRFRKQASCGRILVIGDAMRYIEPFTGEGMSWGIHCARHIVPFIRDIISQRTFDDDWGQRCTKLLRRRHLTCRLVGAAIRRPVLLKPLLRLGSSKPFGQWLSRKLCWN